MNSNGMNIIELLHFFNACPINLWTMPPAKVKPVVYLKKRDWSLVNTKKPG